jgi:hypothetical protein
MCFRCVHVLIVGFIPNKLRNFVSNAAIDCDLPWAWAFAFFRRVEDQHLFNCLWKGYINCRCCWL